MYWFSLSRLNLSSQYGGEADEMAGILLLIFPSLYQYSMYFNKLMNFNVYKNLKLHGKKKERKKGRSRTKIKAFKKKQKIKIKNRNRNLITMKKKNIK